MLAKDLEELEGNKFKKYCDACEFSEHATNGDWCYLHNEAPEKKCRDFKLKRSLKEANAILGLTKRFERLQDND